MSFAILFTSIGNAGFRGSSLGSTGNFDGGIYGLGKGSPYYEGPSEPKVRLTRMELPVPAVVPIYIPPVQKPVEIETYKLELREEETSLRMRYERSLAFKGFELKQSFDYEYNNKKSLIKIIKEKR